MWTAILTTILGGMGLHLIQRHLAGKPTGAPDAPLPSPGNDPPGSFQEPSVRKVTPDQIYTELTRAFPDMTEAQAEPLIGMFLIATRKGEHVVSNNVAGIGADNTWTGSWTKIQNAVALPSGQPGYQWRDIRAYPTLSLGVQDWLGTLPRRALEAAQAGNIDGFAAALTEARLVNMEAPLYASYLDEAVESRWRA